MPKANNLNASEDTITSSTDEAKAKATIAEVEYLLIFFAVIFISYLIHVYFLVTAKKKELADLS